MRPEFKIIGWREFDLGPAVPRIENGDSGGAGVKAVEPPSLAEETNDEIKF